MQPDIELLLSGFGVYLCSFVCPGLIACSTVAFYVVFSQVKLSEAHFSKKQTWNRKKKEIKVDKKKKQRKY